MASKIGFTLIGLLCSIGVAGCSNSNNRLAGNVFRVVGDCKAPYGQEGIVYGTNSIVSGLSAFGFPQDTVEIGQDSTGPSTGGTRTCTVAYGKDSNDPDEVIYSCFDNGNYACSIIISEN